MRRRIALSMATVLAAGTFALSSPPPASAWVACEAAGAMFITGGGMLYAVSANIPSKTPGLVYDILLGDLQFQNPSYGFTISLPTGVCVHPRTAPPGLDTSKFVRGSGQIKGYCGLASGRGVLDNGDLFAFVIVGPWMILTGHIVGILLVLPNAAAGESCLHVGPKTNLPGAGALSFVIIGVILLLNCTADLQFLVPGTPNDHESLVPLATQQHLNPLFHAKVNIGIHYYWNHQCFNNPVL